MPRRTLRGCSIAVVGAGLAGLTAAVELRRHGAAVTVLEARDRVGGRVLTIREPFAEGHHAEAGGDFIDEEHEHIRRLVGGCGLKLVPILRKGFSFVRRGAHAGQVVSLRPGVRVWTVLAEKLKPQLRAFELSEQRWDSQIAKQLARMSVAEWMKTVPLDPALRGLLVGLRGFFLADPADLSLLALVEQLASGRPGQGGMFRIAGGNDRLPRALAAVLGNHLRLKVQLLAVSQSRKKVRVRIRLAAGVEQHLDVDYLVLTIPTTTLRTLDIHPSLPSEQMQAVSGLRYGSVTKTLLQFDRRFWRRRSGVLAYGTNLSVGAVWDGNEQQNGRPGILCLMAGGQASLETKKELAEKGVAGLVRSLNWLGAARRVLIAHHSACWEDDAWVRGGYAIFSPSYDPLLRQWLARPHGRIFFAGEHTSLRWQGYMEGAVQSGLRVAAEIRAMKSPAQP